MFDSRDSVHRDPFGAVAAGATVHFKITLPRDLHCSAATLLVKNDLTGAEFAPGLFWCGMNGEDKEWWECHFTPPEAGLYFYRFSLETRRGTLSLSHDEGGESILLGGQQAGGLWQLTAYDPNFQTPGWLAGGVIYQIFPDRFCNSGTEKQNVPADRKLHGSWSESPDWEADPKKTKNNDYFGGDLRGMREKLGYLKSLGVTCLYLNPIFEAHSNHRYDTADYTKIDPLLGTEEDFSNLCRDAEGLGIRILLDGVFNHTGSDSVYFNRQGRYRAPGAYQSKESEYFPWYHFKNWPGEYDCWWDVFTLPNVDELNPAFDAFVNGPDGVIRKWLHAGAAGWRLDVADELPDAFLEHLRAAAKAEKPDALVLGEVWEDASNKISYGRRRRYLLGNQLDSVMNYPFRDAILGFLTWWDAEQAMERILAITEHYPPQVLNLLMNNIGTHDTVRALTALAGEPLGGHERSWQSKTRLTPEQRERGKKLLRLASLLQYTLPGVPCVYYGDEAGMEGYRDPFNRNPYPWGNEDGELVEWYRLLGGLRGKVSFLRAGEFRPVAAEGDVLAYIRADESAALLCACSRAEAERSITLPEGWQGAEVLLGNPPDAENRLNLGPFGYAVLLR